ncbi:unnamed protein product [Gordionus sp. m RMFG-2023]
MTICAKNNLTCEYIIIDDDDIVKTRKVQLKESEKDEHLYLRYINISGLGYYYNFYKWRGYILRNYSY